MLALVLLFGSPPGTADAIAEAMHAELLIPSTVEAGRPRAWRYCERAKGGCAQRLHAFARAFVEAGDANGVSPWLLAAIVMKESKANPAAEGRGGERGIMQIHPSRREAREDHFLRAWFHDDDYRAACLEAREDACQGRIIALGAEILGRALESTGGDEVRALSMYNTGRADSDAGRKYAAAVKRWRERLEK